MKNRLSIFGLDCYITDLILILLCYLLLENAFSWLLLPNALIATRYESILSLGVFCFMIYSFQELELYEKLLVSLFALLIIKLIFESLYMYGTVFKHFYMFTVIFPVVYTIFVKLLIKQLKVDLLEFLANFYLLIYIVFMLVYGRAFGFDLGGVDLQDLGPFSGDSRILHARSIFMIIIPLLWYLNKYITTKDSYSLFWIVFCFAVIVLHQHRSVWASCIFAICYYLFMLFRLTPEYKPRVIKFFFLSVLSLIAVVAIISIFKSSIVHFFVERFNEILEPNKEGGTGSFRILQRETYFELYLERPFWGWSFDGYELENPLVDWWPAKTGQHFHEGFIEVLFYHGIFGLLLKYSLLIVVFFRSFDKCLSGKSIILTSFCLSGLVFSLSYVTPLIYWGHVGLCLHYIEKDKRILRALKVFLAKPRNGKAYRSIVRLS